MFAETASFLRIFNRSAFLGFFGVWALVFFLWTTKWAKNPKSRIRGLAEAVSAKFSSDIKVAHDDSATDEPKKISF